jgi:hypothetical protein
MELSSGNIKASGKEMGVITAAVIRPFDLLVSVV